MEKGDFLQELVENVLIEIDFINRYQVIAEKFRERDESFRVDNAKVIEIASSLKFRLKYSKAKEFHLEEQDENFNYKFGFTIRYNSFDFGISIVNESLGIHTSAPWGFLVQLLSNGKRKVTKAAFKNYEDIEAILKEAFSIYTDIKTGLSAYKHT